MSKVITESREFLQENGIDLLTGEACGLGMRILADLTPEGIEIMSEFLGTPIQPGNAWNHGCDSASVMLPHSIIYDLVMFILLRYEYDVALMLTTRYGQTSIYAYSKAEWDDTGETVMKTVHDQQMKYRIFAKNGNVIGGTRNQHEFSGRAI